MIFKALYCPHFFVESLQRSVDNEYFGEKRKLSMGSGRSSYFSQTCYALNYHIALMSSYSPLKDLLICIKILLRGGSNSSISFCFNCTHPKSCERALALICTMAKSDEAGKVNFMTPTTLFDWRTD